MPSKRELEIKLLAYEAQIYREGIRQDLSFLRKSSAPVAPLAGAVGVVGLLITVLGVFRRRNKTQSAGRVLNLQTITSWLWLARRLLELRTKLK